MTSILSPTPLPESYLQGRHLSDSQRDAEKYRRLVLALRHATKQIRLLGSQGQVEIETGLAELLPDIATAFHAQSAFLVYLATANDQASSDGQVDVKAVEESNNGARLRLLHCHPAAAFVAPFVEQNGLLLDVLYSQRARVFDSLEADTPGLIKGLEFCQATAAILVPIQMVDRQYLVGICNKIDPRIGPFLASDRMTLETLLELMAIGGRSSENRRREAESIERLSKIAVTGSPREVADAIVFEAVAVTHSSYAALWTVDKHSMTVAFFTVHHANDQSWQPQQLTLPLDETSFIGFSAANDRIIHVQDVESEKRFLRWDRQTRSALCIPLSFNHKVLGVLYIANDHIGGISNERRQYLERLAPHAAIALHNARLSDIRQRVIRFQQDISDVMPLDQQLDQILGHLQDQVDIDGLFLAMYDADLDEVTFPLVLEKGEPAHARLHLPGAHYGPQAPGQLRFGFVEWVLQHRKPLLVENFNVWPYRNSIDVDARRGIKSCVVVPLIRQERIVGAIGLRSYFSSPGTFDEYDQHFLEGIADQIAIILRNSQHYDTTQQILEETNQQLRDRIRALRAVSEFQRRISNVEEEAQEIQNIYTIAREAMEGVGLDVSNMYIAIYDEQAGTIHFPLAYEHSRPVAETMKQGDSLYSRTTFGEHRSVAEWLMQRWQREQIRDALLIEANFKEWVRQHQIRTFPTNTQCWLGAPMVYKEKLLGMIGLRNPHRDYAFKEEHKELLEIIAAQAAVAIDNARLYDAQKQEVSHFRALHETGKAITRAGLDLDAILHAIVEQAVDVTNSFFGTLQLVRGDHLEFVAAWPPERKATVMAHHKFMALDGDGITVRAVRENDAQLVSDVRLDEGFIDATDGKSGSAIAVVLRHGGETGKVPMGVLNVEHEAIGGLTNNDRSVLIGLANLAMVAVENANHVDELSRTNAVAVMGAWGADIVHDIHREVGAIRLTIDALRTDPDLTATTIYQGLDKIDEYIQNLVMPALPEPTSNGETFPYARDTIPVDLVVAAEVALMRQRHGGVIFAIQTACPHIEVKIPEQWLRRLLRHLVINSVRANQGQTDLMITVGTNLHGNQVEVWVADNGRGIRAEIEHQLFHRPVPHGGGRSAERHGRGLLLVRYIVELHGGHAWLKENEVEKGACLAFTVPRVLENHA